MFWRRDRISALIQSPKDFALRQGGKRRKGRSILRYVTDFTRAANAVSAQKTQDRAQEFAWRL
ncbi:hypothetical protein E7735_04130 [Enterobacter cloacae]|nr:hypothetical protein CIW65_19485 [Enterobacter cloacae]PAO14095.1 hypothetical protein CIW57_19875 [Enterobacter cloacae]QCC89634.1 hypothetical protein E7735_01020 [Enterobacter cloacae]QCC90190.1 hypothetical protein E7735_04130 [Enterobacter cloacae]QCC94631.1 hypothetical protein E7739_00705 [Enterobacter cloacae]